MTSSTRNPEPLPGYLERYAHEVDEWQREATEAQAVRRAAGQRGLRFSTT